MTFSHTSIRVNFCLSTFSASLDTTGSDRAPSVASNQSSSSTSQSSTPLPVQENGERFTIEDREVFSITNGHDYVNIRKAVKKIFKPAPEIKDDSDQLVLKVDSSKENGVCITMVPNGNISNSNPKSKPMPQPRNSKAIGTPESSPKLTEQSHISNGAQSEDNVHLNVDSRDKSDSPQCSPGHSPMNGASKSSKPRPSVPVRTVSLPMQITPTHNGQVLSTFKPKDSRNQLENASRPTANSRLAKVSEIIDKV